MPFEGPAFLAATAELPLPLPQATSPIDATAASPSTATRTTQSFFNGQTSGSDWMGHASWDQLQHNLVTPVKLV